VHDQKDPERAIQRAWDRVPKIMDPAEKFDVVPELDDETFRELIGPKPKANPVTFIQADQVEQKPIRWIWKNRLARGKITAIAGYPGMAKSQIAIDAAARITTGGQWPDGGKAPQGSVGRGRR
jgi:hypothetical protein